MSIGGTMSSVLVDGTSLQMVKHLPFRYQSRDKPTETIHVFMLMVIKGIV